MKLIIAGKRDWRPSPERLLFLVEGAWSHHRVTEVVSGGASGVDTSGERFAEKCELPLRRFPANWDEHGKAAGPIRNRQMAEYADALLLIWDGKSRGSGSMLKEARKAGLKIVQVVWEDGT